MKPSTYQQAILDCLSRTTKNLIVQACAGSGKTTTLRLICEWAPKSMSIIALCFAKINQADFQKKLPKHVDTSTMHSLCLRIIRENFSGVVVDSENRKRDEITTRMFGRPNSRTSEQKLRAMACERAAPLVVANMLNLKDVASLTDTIRFFLPELAVQDWSLLANDIGCYLADKRADKRRVDFDDMLDFVAHYQLMSNTTYDLILGDEVQDWTKLQAALAWQIANNGATVTTAKSPLDDLLGLTPGQGVSKVERPTASRLVLVGDERQAIYGFRGADTKSMSALADRFHATTLPLAVCYRCPTSVVAEAQKIVGADFILPREGAEAGEVINTKAADFDDEFNKLPMGTLIISRTNAPLVRLALRSIVDGKKAIVRGRDIGRGLIKSLRKFSKSTDDLQEVLDEARVWYVRNVRKLFMADRITAATSMMDQFECFETILLSVDNARDAATQIENLFKDDMSPGLTMSSIHKAKGLEEDIVAIISPDRIPHPMVVKSGNAELIEQEWNMLYVAITRAMKTLYMMPMPKKEGSAASDLAGFISMNELKIEAREKEKDTELALPVDLTGELDAAMAETRRELQKDEGDA